MKRGDVIGLVGNSGSSFEPHLHFEVTNSPAPLRGEGIPYLIDAFAVMENGAPVQHRRELPIAESLIVFDSQPSRASRRYSRPASHIRNTP